VDASFFSVLGSTLLAGRPFDTRDVADTSKSDANVINANQVTAVIINESLARTYFAGKNPVGMKVQPFPRSRTPVSAQVVGVVGDVRHFGLREQAGPALYLPITEMDAPWAPTIAMRLSRDVSSTARDIRRIVDAVDPRIHSLNLRSMDQQIDAYLEKERM